MAMKPRAMKKKTPMRGGGMGNEEATNDAWQCVVAWECHEKR